MKRLSTRKILPSDRPMPHSTLPWPILHRKPIFGLVKQRENKKTLEIGVPLVFESPVGLSAGLTWQWGTETTVTEDGRMDLYRNIALRR